MDKKRATDKEPVPNREGATANTPSGALAAEGGLQVPVQQALAELMTRAESGEEESRQGVQNWLAKAPDATIMPAGDLARYAILGVLCGKNIVFQEDVRRQMKTLHAQLAGPSPSALESLLVERIVTCWLHLHCYEKENAQRLDGQSVDQSQAHGRRVDQAQRRYLSAIKALAQVRRLDLPAVQVNIGQHQNIAKKVVNVGGIQREQPEPGGNQAG